MDAYERLEQCEDQHALSDFEGDVETKKKSEQASAKRIRITQADLVKHGHTDGCPRCEAHQSRHARTNQHHSEWCRIRIYGEWEQAGDPTIDALNKQLEAQYGKEDVKPGEIDVEGLDDKELQYLVPTEFSEIPAEAEERLINEPDLNSEDLDPNVNEHQPEGDAADLLIDDADQGDVDCVAMALHRAHLQHQQIMRRLLKSMAGVAFAWKQAKGANH